MRRVLTVPNKTYPTMAAPISMMMMKERKTANQERTNKVEVTDKGEESQGIAFQRF